MTDCRPAAGTACFLYHITMALTCPLPEEQNTRGRQIRAPEDSPQGFGILTSRRIPSVGAFPIFTRAGEVSFLPSLNLISWIFNPSIYFQPFLYLFIFFFFEFYLPFLTFDAFNLFFNL